MSAHDGQWIHVTPLKQFIRTGMFAEKNFTVMWLKQSYEETA